MPIDRLHEPTGSRRAHSDHQDAGLPVTQRRPWPAEAVWSEARAAPARRTGAGKRSERFLAASLFRVIRDVLNSNGGDCACQMSLKRIRTRCGRERSESMSGERFPARGSRPRPDKAGDASAAAESRCRAGVQPFKQTDRDMTDIRVTERSSKLTLGPASPRNRHRGHTVDAIAAAVLRGVQRSVGCAKQRLTLVIVRRLIGGVDVIERT